MSLRWMLDTDICVQVVRDRPPELRQAFNEAADQLCISQSVFGLTEHAPDCQGPIGRWPT